MAAWGGWGVGGAKEDAGEAESTKGAIAVDYERT